MTIQKNKQEKIKKLRNFVEDLIWQNIYCLSDYAEDEAILEYCCASLTEDFNKLTESKNFLVFSKKRLQRIKYIMNQDVRKETIEEKTIKICKVFGFNYKYIAN